MHSDELVPPEINTKAEFWNHIVTQLEHLLDGQRNWVTNTASASSLIYYSLQAFPAYFGTDINKAVNWVGVYIDSKYFPPSVDGPSENRLLLGPFCGKPACMLINTTTSPSRPNPGVCADGFIHARSLLVPDVEQYPGHIACSALTKSEIVCPLFNGTTTVGVLDLDCLALGGFDQEDLVGLERCAALISRACDWKSLN
ncbi:GAF domain-like protein [Marasmius fiardii PR-910]|nr:GAF domain-like protein [Marasmius fiardii PR-910]